MFLLGVSHSYTLQLQYIIPSQSNSNKNHRLQSLGSSKLPPGVQIIDAKSTNGFSFSPPPHEARNTIKPRASVLCGICPDVSRIDPARDPLYTISHAQKVATGQAVQFLSALPREYSSAICETMRGHESVNGTVNGLERGNARARGRL